MNVKINFNILTIQWIFQWLEISVLEDEIVTKLQKHSLNWKLFHNWKKQKQRPVEYLCTTLSDRHLNNLHRGKRGKPCNKSQYKILVLKFYPYLTAVMNNKYQDA